MDTAFPPIPVQVLHVPHDVELLAAVGRVVITHGHLNHILIRTIRTFAKMRIQDADYDLAKVPMDQLRLRIGRLAAEKLGMQTDAYKTLMRLLDDCATVTMHRNRLVHCLWVSDWEHREPVLVCRTGTFVMPSTAVIDGLADAIRGLAENINEGRLSGFIAEALAAKEADGGGG